jgi:hypothetical protein
MQLYSFIITILSSPLVSAALVRYGSDYVPPPPAPEPIMVTELPLPPVVSNSDIGACTTGVNPHGTGCIGIDTGLQNGNFLPDNEHVVAIVNFVGAPAAPHPSSIYAGLQFIIVKINGTFPNGDPWKCITCGVPAENQVARMDAMDYPQAFDNGRQALSGTNIIDCGENLFASTSCTPDKVYIYPIRLDSTADGSGEGLALRELRIHPDNVHLGFNAMVTNAGLFAQFTFFGRLVFNPAPTTGLPLAPRYDLKNVSYLTNSANPQPVYTKDGYIYHNSSALAVGELRGFTKRANEVTYVGSPVESCNIDVFAADLQTGNVRRLTANPEYVDPVDISYDDQWTVVMDTRGTDRQIFMAGMRNVPPMTDMVNGAITSSIRNNGRRRFFEPFLIDRYGDRGDYNGQKINAGGDGSPGSVNDPQWNGRADPKFSPDGTYIVYYQELTISPACGGINPLPCPVSTAQGGRIQRMMIAHLTTRKKQSLKPIAIAPDNVPWGTPYVPGGSFPEFEIIQEGIYKLNGKVSGSAEVNITLNSAKTSISSVAVSYYGYTNDGINVISGSEKVTSSVQGYTVFHSDWYSNLTEVGSITSTKLTSSDGFHVTIDLLTNILEANGTLTLY